MIRNLFFVLILVACLGVVYVSGISLFSSSSDESPSIAVSSDLIDLGTCFQGAISTGSFDISNTSKSSGLSLEVSSGCGCTYISADSHLLEAGEKTTIRFSIKTEDRKGVVVVPMFLCARTVAGEIINKQVIGRVTVSDSNGFHSAPELVSIKGHPGSVFHTVIKIISESETPFQANIIKLPEWMQASATKVEPDGVTFSLHGNCPMTGGVSQPEVLCHVKSNDGRELNFLLPIQCDVLTVLKPEKAAIVLSTERRQFVTSINLSCESSVKIESIHSELRNIVGGNSNVEVKVNSESSNAKLRLKGRVDDNSQTFRAVIVLRALLSDNDKSWYEEVRVPVIAMAIH